MEYSIQKTVHKENHHLGTLYNNRKGKTYKHHRAENSRKWVETIIQGCEKHTNQTNGHHYHHASVSGVRKMGNAKSQVVDQTSKGIC